MESDLYYLLALLLCFLFSAIFSSAETALTSLPESYFRKALDQKTAFEKPFSLWIHKPNKVLTAIIVGNNLVNTLSAVITTVYAQRLFGDYVISIATTFVTLALLIFGEITPKTFARHNAKSIAKWMLYIIYPVYFLLFPLVEILSQLAVFLVHTFGGRTKRTGPLATEDDIEYLIKLSHEEGVFKKEHGQMLQSVLSFRDIAAREIMVPRTNVSSLEINSSLKEVMQEINLHGYSRWPVYSEDEDIDHIIGILYVKDLIDVNSSNPQNFSLKKYLRKPLFIPESMKLDKVLGEFQKKNVHLGIVVDEYGGTAGILTMEDLLEEIVGEIRDEYDKDEDEETIKKVKQDHFIIEGKISISDLQKRTGIALPPDEAYDSLAGFLIATIGKIPTQDSVLEYKNWKFKIIEVEEKRILKVEITKTDTQAR